MQNKYQRAAAAKKSLPKPLRIEKKMVHGQLVDVKIYASTALLSEGVTARVGKSRRAAK